MAMKIPLSSADHFYLASASLQFRHIPVTHRLFRSFGKAHQRFKKRLGEAARDPYWSDFYYWLSRFHFRAMVTPLPFDHPALYSASDVDRFRARLANSEALYPGLSAASFDLLDRMEQLAQTGANPLLEGLLRLVNGLHDLRETALVTPDTRLCDAVEELLAAHRIAPFLELVSPSQLRGRSFRRLILTGPARAFPHHLFTAPRAPELDLLHYKWVSGQPALEPVFYSPQPDGVELVTPEPEETDPDEDLYPAGTIDVNRYLHSPANSEREDSPAEQVDINARLFILEDQTGLFLESGSSTLVIDPEEAGNRRVIRKDVPEVDPGMFLLVKQGGGGDYIVPVADSLMGEQAAMARATQRRWKDALRSLVAERGIQGTRVRLSECGALRPYEWNLRNWMGASSIRPGAFEDLAAILTASDQGHWAPECWRILGAIDSAHSQAGMLIRQQLLAEVSRTDLQRLQRNGRMEFTVEAASQVRMIALRVLKVLPGPYKVPASRLNNAFDLEERDAWLE